MKAKFTILILVLSSWGITAQNFSDALRYSKTLVSGTARTVSVGAAYSSLGADFSVLNINPAGLATYRKSEITVTPSLFFGKDEARFEQGANNESKSNVKFYLDNVGYVRASRRNPASSWKTSNFAVGINRIAEFDEKFTFSGTSQGSIVDRWYEISLNVEPSSLDNYEAGPAYDAEALFLWDGTSYATDVLPEDMTAKAQTVERDGGIYELAFGWAGNYNEKFSLGIGLGVPFVAYEESKNYTETDGADLVPVFNELRFQENLTVSGAGINLKLGTIIHPNRKIRLGLSVESPTYYALREDFNTIVGYSYTFENEFIANSQSSPDGTFNYRLNSPWKANAGISYLFSLNKINGFLSAAADYKNFSAARFSFSGDEAGEQVANMGIEEQLTSALNYHFGSEIAIQKMRFRAGLILDASPFLIDEDSNVFNKIYSFGIGFRANRFFVDTAFRLSTGTEGYSPYLVNQEDAVLQTVILDKTFNKFLLTFGYKL